MRTRKTWLAGAVLALGLAGPASANDMLGLDAMFILAGAVMLGVALALAAVATVAVAAFEAAVISYRLEQPYPLAFGWALLANGASTLSGMVLLALGAQPGWKLALVDGQPLLTVLPLLARSFLATVLIEGLVLLAFTRRAAKPRSVVGAVALANTLSYTGLALLLYLVGR